MAKESITVTLDTSTISLLKEIAREECRDVNSMIDDMVLMYVKQKKESIAKSHDRAVLFCDHVKKTNYKETQEALEKNVFIDEEDRAFLKQNK